MRLVARSIVLAVVLGVLAGPARADEADARRLFQKAELSFNVGKFAEALTDYQAAYEAKPLNGFLFNIAQCYRNLGDPERARFFFRRYLTLEPRAPNRRRVEALIDEMTRKLEEKAAKPAEAPAAAPPAPAPETKATEPATPSVEPSSPAPAPAPAPAPSAVAVESEAPAVVAVAPPPSPPPESPVWERWWFWTGVGAVVVGGAVAAFFLTRPETRAPGTLDPIDGR